MPALQCHFCGTSVTIGEPIPRDSECESCGHDLRSCRNCRHWDPRYNNECTETMADPVEDKTRRNFCEYFYFSHEAYAAPTGRGREADARAKLAGLFKKGPPKEPGARENLGKRFGGTPSAEKPSDARDRLDALFRKKPPGNEGESEE